jgi:UDP-N-acetyl-D-galactosamine dehydrogenase
MGKYVAEQTVKQMIASGSDLCGGVVTVLGLTFKEDCADLRNSQVIPMVRELRSYGLEVRVCDPWADREEAGGAYGIGLDDSDSLIASDAVVLAVAHTTFVDNGHELVTSILKTPGTVIDVKSALDASRLRDEGVRVWRL